MGWTYFSSLGRDTIDLLKSEMEGENDFAKWQWLDHARRGSVVYAVIRKTPKLPSNDTTYVHDADGSFRFIVVLQTSRKGEPGYDFGYKDITESMGPVEKDCPLRLLDLASPLRDDYQGYGRQWRDACRQKVADARRTKATRPKPGDTFRTLRPVSFRDGTRHTEFFCRQVRHRGRMATVYAAKGSGALYRFRPEAFGFEIVSPQTKTETAS